MNNKIIQDNLEKINDVCDKIDEEARVNNSNKSKKKILRGGLAAVVVICVICSFFKLNINNNKYQSINNAAVKVNEDIEPTDYELEVDIINGVKRTETNPDIFCFGGVGIKNIAEDLKAGQWVHGYSDKFYNKDEYLEIINGDNETKAAFMSLVYYYYYCVVPYSAKQLGMHTNAYLNNNTNNYHGNELMNDCINRCIDTLNHSFDENIEMHIVDNTDLMDLGTILNVGYWVDLGCYNDFINQDGNYVLLFLSLSHELYEIYSEYVFSATIRSPYDFSYEVKGGPISYMFGHREYDGVDSEFLRNIEADDLNRIYDSWLKYFNS